MYKHYTHCGFVFSMIIIMNNYNIFLFSIVFSSGIFITNLTLSIDKKKIIIKDYYSVCNKWPSSFYMEIFLKIKNRKIWSPRDTVKQTIIPADFSIIFLLLFISWNHLLSFFLAKVVTLPIYKEFCYKMWLRYEPNLLPHVNFKLRTTLNSKD